MSKPWSGLTRRLPSSGTSTSGPDTTAGPLTTRKASGGATSSAVANGGVASYQSQGSVVPIAHTANPTATGAAHGAGNDGKINGTTGMITIAAEMGGGLISGGIKTFSDAAAGGSGHTVVKMPAAIDPDDDKYAKKPTNDRQSRYNHNSSTSAGLRRMAIGFLAFVILAIAIIELMTRSRTAEHTAEPL
eukprot:m.33580 g.33580  ORF g.33580 m.33580 type:complete len:189 (+) comp14243_c0_seq2:853-1419(+)